MANLDAQLSPEVSAAIGEALAKAGPELVKVIGASAPMVLKTVQGLFQQSGGLFLQALDALPIPKEAKAFFHSLVDDAKDKVSKRQSTNNAGNSVKIRKEHYIGAGVGLALGILLSRALFR